MKTSDFDYALPDRLIAQHPSPVRTGSRLLALDGATGGLRDLQFTDLPQLLRTGDLLVVNDTRVIPARLLGKKATGGSIELLVERVQGSHTVLAQLRASKAPKPDTPGAQLLFEDGAGGEITARVTGRAGDFFIVRFDSAKTVLEVLEGIGHMPLPPYIERAADEDEDKTRYQTVYAARPGAVAAPTAGLHFDEGLLQRLGTMGVAHATLTLHVGAGTFQPVRVADIAAHKMHSEYIEVSAALVDRIKQTQASGGRVIAVGTTVVRALESAARAHGGTLAAYSGETDIFITPGYNFNVVDALITNFHLPQSTLLMLICAYAGREQVLGAYRHAVAHEYRFFSYGDAMLITPMPEARS